MKFSNDIKDQLILSKLYFCFGSETLCSVLKHKMQNSVIQVLASVKGNLLLSSTSIVWYLALTTNDILKHVLVIKLLLLPFVYRLINHIHP